MTSLSNLVIFGWTLNLLLDSDEVKVSFLSSVNLIKSRRIHRSKLASATNGRIQTNNRVEITSTRNEVFLANANVVFFEIICKNQIEVCFTRGLMSTDRVRVW